jgi:hypothetical protein
LESCKFRCKDCGRTFWQRFLGILPRKRATEPFRRSVFVQHCDGVNRSRLGRREAIGSATVERWFQDYLARELAERRGAACPRILGIDEHFFSKKEGYATTFCDLRAHKIFDVVWGRSEAALDDYLAQLPGKDRVRIVCMDLSSVYRAIVRKHFPKAKTVADRFHVIRLVNHHFLACWRERLQTSWLGLTAAPPSPSSQTEAAEQVGAVFRAVPGLACDLSLQTTALLLTAEETPNAQAVRSSGEPFSQSPARVESGRPVAARPTRPNDGILVRRDCDHVAVYSQ